MKKLLFTIEVFVLIASLPVYLVAELNHDKPKFQVDVPSSAFIEKGESIKSKPVIIDTDSHFSLMHN